MSGPNLTQVNIIRNLADQYSDIPEQFLTEGLGRNPTLEEFASFIEFSVANIFGGMYDILRDAKNPQEAETWLKRTLSVTSALVRTRGSDAILKFEVTVKEVPNTLHKKQGTPEAVPKDVQKQPQPPPAAAAAPQCQCQIDTHGRCSKCSGILAIYFQGVIQPFLKMKELAEQTKGICPHCQPVQTDYAISTIMPTLLKRSEGAEEILPVIYQMAQMMGAKELPLTNKAYSEVAGGPPKS